jgi:hypothetical protein
MSNPLFPNHKPEDADLSNIPGYTGHPGQDRVKPDLQSQHEHSAQGYADKKRAAEQKIGGQEEQARNAKKQAKAAELREELEDELKDLEYDEHNEKRSSSNRKNHH